MADLRFSNNTPNLPIMQPQPNAVDAFSQGIQGGAGLGFKARALAIAQQQANQDQYQNKIGLLKAYTDQYDKFSDVPSYQKYMMTNHIIPLNNELMGSHGQQIDASKINFDEDTDPLNELHALNKKLGNKEIDLPTYANALSILESDHAKNKPFVTLVEKQLNDSVRLQTMKNLEANRNQTFDFKKEQTWQRLSDKVNDLNASSRKALGAAAIANMRANRLQSLATDPNATPEDIHREIVDLEGIMMGGVPHEISVKYGAIDNLSTKLTKLDEFITSNPKKANLPEWQKRLIDISNGLRQIDNKIIDDNLGINAVGYRGLIKEDPMRWNDMVDAVNKSTQSPVGGNADLTAQALESLRNSLPKAKK